MKILSTINKKCNYFRHFLSKPGFNHLLISFRMAKSTFNPILSSIFAKR